nr:aminopeptidase M1-like isoform X2 [Tanacetum cinerariifolium]
MMLVTNVKRKHQARLLYKQQNVPEPTNFENNGVLWLPPKPEDEEDKREALLFNDDDDDVDAAGEWGCLCSSSNLRSGDCVKNLVGVEDEDDKDSWLEIITSLSWEAASLLKPDTSKGGGVRIKSLKGVTVVQVLPYVFNDYFNTQTDYIYVTGNDRIRYKVELKKSCGQFYLCDDEWDAFVAANVPEQTKTIHFILQGVHDYYVIVYDAEGSECAGYERRTVGPRLVRCLAEYTPGMMLLPGDFLQDIWHNNFIIRCDNLTFNVLHKRVKPFEDKPVRINSLTGDGWVEFVLTVGVEVGQRLVFTNLLNHNISVIVIGEDGVGLNREDICYTMMRRFSQRKPLYRDKDDTRMQQFCNWPNHVDHVDEDHVFYTLFCAYVTDGFKLGLWREFGKRCGFVEPKMMHMKLVGTVTENSHGAQIQVSVFYKVVPSEVVVDKDDKTLVLVFDEALHVGDGVLEIKFNGVLSEHMKGFYQRIYVDGGRATFKTVGNVTSKLTTLSNMHVSEETIDGDFKTVSFEESPLMSTYLVALWLVSLITSKKQHLMVRTYCPVGKTEKGKLALSFSIKSIIMVAVLDFSGETMENYGLITYREAELLHDDLHSAAENTQRVGHVYILRYGQDINVSYNFYLIDLLFMSAFACCHT